MIVTLELIPEDKSEVQTKMFQKGDIAEFVAINPKYFETEKTRSKTTIVATAV